MTIARSSPLICWLVLPLPPSTNHIYQRTRSGGLMLAPAVLAYRETVRLELTRVERLPATLNPPFQLAVWAYVPKGRHDGDNLLKTIGDALALALGFDDNDIQQYYVAKRPAGKGSKGFVHVELSEMGSEWVRMETHVIAVG